MDTMSKRVLCLLFALYAATALAQSPDSPTETATQAPAATATEIGSTAAVAPATADEINTSAAVEADYPADADSNSSSTAALPPAAETPATADEVDTTAGVDADYPADADANSSTAMLPPATPAPIEVLSSSERETLRIYVDGVISLLRREHDLAALTVAVVKDDSVWLAQGYGQSDLASARAAAADSSLFRIGSVSKTFIWTAAMMLVERGKLDLDADVNTYLKSVRVAEAFGAPVTMRQLMHHRAGFEDSMRLFAVADDDRRSLSELLTEQQPKRVYAPGLRTSYSNWGAALAAQVVEDASGVPYGEFLQREILDPLGMSATTWKAPSLLHAQRSAELATGYQRESGALDVQGYMQLGAYWPAGGIASTATDMSRWMRMHLNGGELEGVRLMSAETHAQMWTRGYDDRPGAADLAHGFQDRSYHGLRLLGHGGATAAFLTQMVLVPELRLGIFMSQNGTYTRTPTKQLPQLIIDHIHGDRYQPALAVAMSDAGTLAEVNGTYLENRRVFSSFAALLALNKTAKVSARSDQSLLVQTSDAFTQFRRVGNERDLFEATDGDRLTFVREGGKVVALVDSSGVHTLEKVGLLGMPMTLFGAFVASLLLAGTTLLGFWWRLGRGSAYGEGYAAGLAATASLLSALCVFGFSVILVLMLIDFSHLDLSNLAGQYPSECMLHTHYAGWAMAGAGAAMLLALIPAWKAAGWGWWRRLHYSAFAIALALTAYLMWQWRVFAAPVY